MWTSRHAKLVLVDGAHDPSSTGLADGFGTPSSGSFQVSWVAAVLIKALSIRKTRCYG